MTSLPLYPSTVIFPSPESIIRMPGFDGLGNCTSFLSLYKFSVIAGIKKTEISTALHSVLVSFS